jgi:hypothetical protein
MPTPQHSLLAGRNQTPLSPAEIRRAVNTFLGMDSTATTRYEAESPTVFRVEHDASGVEYGEIAFGPDIYPGEGVVDPNSSLSLDAAAAHELTHYQRWRNKAALNDIAMIHLDEALTSLEAIVRYERHLNSQDVRQLVADAIQRLRLHAEGLKEANPTAAAVPPTSQAER